MFPLPVLPNRPPFVPPALPGFIAFMGASDFRLSCPLPRFLYLSEGALSFRRRLPDLPGCHMVSM